jgi:methionine synthase II (cobalamin-independent)
LKIQEIFDNYADIVWQQNGRFELASFVCGEKYVIQIDRKNLNQFPELKRSRVAEISFFRYDVDDSDAAHTTARQDLDVPVKVYGIVLNALLKKMEEYDAFFFSAETKHSRTLEEYKSKKSIYFWIADRVSKKLSGVTLYEYECNVSAQFLISKIKLAKETQNATGFKNALAEALAATTFTFASAK